MVRRLKTGKKRLTRLLSDLLIRYRTRELDPLFYFHQYEDLKSLGSVNELRRHYANHGRKERRYPNRISYFEHKKKEVLGSPGQFDVVAYKYYNRDLLAHFTRDEQFLEHYVQHGINEGRLSRFPRGEDSDPHELWQSILSCPQVLAWSGDRFSYPPTNRKDLIAAFKERGMNELWPTSFENIFDASFYRSTYKLSSGPEKSDSDAYRHFLQEGFPKGYAPNELAFLYSYLGGTAYPEHFDWAGYSTAVAMAGRPDRISALDHLFTFGHRDFSPFVKFMGEDAAPLLRNVGKHALAKGKFETAAAAFAASLDIHDCADTACLLGDAYRGLGKTQDALATYQRSVATGSAPIWSYFHCIDIFCGRKDFESAFTILRGAWKSWRHKPSYYERLENCIELYFQHRSAEAHRLYRKALRSSVPGARHQVDELLRHTLEQIEALYRELDIRPALTGGQPDGYVAILANDDLRQCTHYRVEQKIMQFEEAGIPVRLFSYHDVPAFMDSLVGARAAIFYRVAALPKILRAILHANSMGIPTYYEIDDLIFDSSCYPDPFPSFEDQISEEEYAGLQFGVPLFRHAMAMCSHSIASTPALAAKMQAITSSGTGIVVRNGLDGRNDLSIQMGAQPRPSNGRIRIFYGSGTKAHNADFNELVGPALLALMERHPEVDLVIVGHLKLRPELAALRDRVMIYPIIADINAYWSLLKSCDINLAVLHPGPVADCKSEIKWLEAAVLQIPSIVSETATYRDVVQHDVTGYLASDPDDWRHYLEKLIADKDIRDRIGANARARALRAYSLEAAAEILRDAFDHGQQKKNADANERRKLRVLICNVFFDPQSIGGATRVVEDNIRSFTELYDDLEIGVFCSDEGISPPGRLRMGSFGNIPVYRLSTPVEEGMDWRPFNPANEASFERVLDHFKPDIIHFHCIQRVTASIVQVALQRNIPYLVTFHDGWWISDHQFFVDQDGFLRLPTEDVLQDAMASRHPAVSVERRQRLASLLRGAAARLSVSLPFARIYENAGIRDLQVTENGLPEIHPAARVPRSDGRLSLGHVGGRASHKGAYLLEAALRQETFRNLHLTMIDGTIPAGQTVETIWGSTPVTLTGPYPQSRIAELYGQLDVLLAPSTWPESYGLVTREALSLGLWVVTSNLGAIGEGIENGRNGHVIDTRTTLHLKEVLHRLDADHERYRKPPEIAARELRPMEAQARELHAIYWDIARRSKMAVKRGRERQPVSLTAASG